MSVDNDGWEPLQLTSGGLDIQSVACAPDGSQWLFSARSALGYQLIHQINALAFGHRRPGMLRAIMDGGRICSPAITDGGQWACLANAPGDDGKPRNGFSTFLHLWLGEAGGVSGRHHGDPRCVTRALDRDCGFTGGGDTKVDDAPGRKVAISPDGQTILFVPHHLGRSAVWSADRERHELRQVYAVAGGTVKHFAVAFPGRLVTCDLTPANPGRMTLTDKRPRVLWDRAFRGTEPLEEARWTPAMRRAVVPSTPEGIPTWVIEPRDFSPNSRYPVIIGAKGGPLDAHMASHRLLWHLLAERGYLIVLVDRPGCRPRAAEEGHSRCAERTDWSVGAGTRCQGCRAEAEVGRRHVPCITVAPNYRPSGRRSPEDRVMAEVRILAAGVDSLYVSAKGELRTDVTGHLEALQSSVRDTGEPAIFSLPDDSRSFLVNPTGLRRHRLWLRSPSAELLLCSVAPQPDAYVQLHSAFIHTIGIDDAIADIEGMLSISSYFFVRPPLRTVSRIDIHADQQGWEPRRDDLDRFVTRARRRQSFEQVHMQGRMLTGITFGRRDVVALI